MVISDWGFSSELWGGHGLGVERSYYKPEVGKSILTPVSLGKQEKEAQVAPGGQGSTYHGSCCFQKKWKVANLALSQGFVQVELPNLFKGAAPAPCLVAVATMVLSEWQVAIFPLEVCLLLIRERKHPDRFTINL